MTLHDIWKELDKNNHEEIWLDLNDVCGNKYPHVLCGKRMVALYDHCRASWEWSGEDKNPLQEDKDQSPFNNKTTNKANGTQFPLDENMARFFDSHPNYLR
ncbi:TPA: hypothetical protein ACG7PQ_005122 [Klebsiella pneumoniae]